jgi:cation transport ATPase
LIFSAAAISLHVALRYALAAPRLSSLIPLWATLAVGGIPLVWDLTRKAARQDFGSDLLAGISIVRACLLSEYLVACIVILMLSGGGALDEAATRRASSVLQALTRRMPETAHRLTSSGIRDVSLAKIEPGDRFVVLPHEICPVDGVIIEGHGSMDESYLAGEPFNISKAPGAPALSGAINGEAALTMEAIRASSDSRYARIMRVIRESEHKDLRSGAWRAVSARGIHPWQ